MNKRGGLVLRDIMFMLLIVTIVVVLASVFVDDLSTNYDNPNNMSTEFQDSPVYLISNSTFFSTGDDLEDMSEKVDGGLWEMIGGGLNAAVQVMQAVIMAPNTFGDLIFEWLLQLGVPTTFAFSIGIFIKSLLYGLIVFVIISAFLPGANKL